MKAAEFGGRVYCFPSIVTQQGVPHIVAKQADSVAFCVFTIFYVFMCLCISFLIHSVFVE